MATFTPDANQMQQILALLNAGTTGVNQQQVVQQLQAAQQQASYFAHLAYFMCCDTTPQNAALRRVAGSQIKNNLANPKCTESPFVQQYVMQALGDSDVHIRTTVGGIITTAITKNVWDVSTVDHMLRGLQPGQPPNFMLGCLTTLHAIVDEHIELLDAHQRTAAILPALLPYLDHADDIIRRQALEALATILEQAAIHTEGAAFKVGESHLQHMVGAIGKSVTVDQKPKILKPAIKCLYLSLSFQTQMVAIFPGIAKLMVETFPNHPDEYVRLEVVEFWRAVLRFPIIAQTISDHVPTVITFFLNSMVYSEMQLGMMNVRENDAGVADKPEDVKPRTSQRSKAAQVAEDIDEDDEEVEDFNLRNVAAQGLDEMAKFFGETILYGTLTIINDRMQPDKPWNVQESALLGVAAIAEGCFEGVKQHLPALLPRCCELAEAPQTHFLVKAAALYCIPRYGEWILQDDAAKALNLPARCVQVLLARMSDTTSKKLQEMATASLSEFAACCEEGELNPYAGAICQTLAQCLQRYQLKNRYVLFETIEECCTAFEDRMADEDCLNVIIQPLLQLWNETPDDSPLIFPYFECMAALASTVKSAIQPVASQIFTRAYQLTLTHIGQRYTAKTNNQDPPDDSEEFAIAALDLLGGLIEALKGSIEPFIDSVGKPQFAQVLHAALQDVYPPIRQSAFGCLGELCVSACSIVQAHLSTFAATYHSSMQDLTNFTVASNAAWALTQLSCYQIEGQGLETLQSAHIDAYLQVLVAGLIQEHDSEQRNMCDNFCVCIGSLMLNDGDAVGRLPQGYTIDAWFGRWCSHVKNMKNTTPKERATRGMLTQLLKMPALVPMAANHFFDLLTSLPKNMNQDLRTMGKQVLEAVKVGTGAQWATLLNAYDSKLRKKLFEYFGVR